MPTSQNGYPANDISQTQSYTIPGTSRKIRLRKGDAGFLLAHFAAWFDKNVEDIEGGVFDDWGYAERSIIDNPGTLSNHASGTAMDLNATKHPLKKRNTFSAANMAKIRAQLKVYEGAIRWGGDYVNRADEMHFEIEPGTARVARVAAKLRGTPPPATPPTGSVPTAPAADKSLHLWALDYATKGKAMSGVTLHDAAQLMASTRGLIPGTRANELGWLEDTRTGEWTKASSRYRTQVSNLQRHAGILADGVPGPKTADYLRRACGYTILP